jgi:exopolysaccharide biosynthesis polyprenyl glycosylphosphotransferase
VLFRSRNMIVIGTGKEATTVFNMMNEFKYWGIRIAGFLTTGDARNTGCQDIHQTHTLGTINDLPQLLYSQCIDGVIVALPVTHIRSTERVLAICEEMGVTTYVVSNFLRRKIGKVVMEEFEGLPIMAFTVSPQFSGKLALKRLADIIISGPLLLALVPLFSLIAIIIKFTSAGPVFFRQTRVGLYGKKFTLLKFRTMVCNAEALKESLLGRNEMDGPVFKIKNDPRTTAFGKFLRKLSLDELPQLINVWKGDMSLVGPRPPLPEEVDKYERWQIRRLSMRPGITCIWQVAGRNKISKFEDWMKLDLDYIDNWSMVLDFKLLCRTIFSVISCKGAF